ncbi:MAG: Panacea domain-containing protein [Cloacibacillus sp.]
MSLNKRVRCDKALSIILYILSHGCTNMYNLLKVIYFADKEHIRLSGNTMYRENYYALQKGPVPSTAYDMLKYIRGDGICDFDCLRDAPFHFSSEYEIVADKEYNADFLSDIDYICLNDSLKKYGTMPMGQLITASHEESDYKEAEADDRISFESLVKSVDTDGSIMRHIKNVTEQSVTAEAI